jgi:hypothetical protein
MVLGVPTMGRLQRTHDAANFRHHEEPVVESGTVAILLKREAMVAVAVAALKTGKATFLAFPHPLKERLIGTVEAGEHILQDMRVDGNILGEGGAHLLEFGLLLIAGEGDATLLPQRDALL